MMRGMGGPGGGVVNPGNAISHEKKRSALWKLMGLMKPYWPVVAFCCVLGIVLNLANILKPYLMKIAVDEFIGQYEGLGMEKVNELTKAERRALLETLKQFPIDIASCAPVEQAIVTSGGVKVSEVSPKTMESKLVKGLYFAGELLDVDAYTGGFNLQIAWATGRLAGSASAQEG